MKHIFHEDVDIRGNLIMGPNNTGVSNPFSAIIGTRNLINEGTHNIIIGSDNKLYSETGAGASVDLGYNFLAGTSYNTVTGHLNIVLGGGSNNILGKINANDPAGGNIALGCYSSTITGMGLNNIIIGGFSHKMTNSSSCYILGNGHHFSGDYWRTWSIGGSLIAFGETGLTVDCSMLGGANNLITDSKYGSMFGGSGHWMQGSGHHMFGGGYNRIESGNNNTFLGGEFNTGESSTKSLVIGGDNNLVKGSDNLIIGAESGTATGTRGIVIGGLSNISEGSRSVSMGIMGTASNFGQITVGGGAFSDSVRGFQTSQLQWSDVKNGGYTGSTIYLYGVASNEAVIPTGTMWDMDLKISAANVSGSGIYVSQQRLVATRGVGTPVIESLQTGVSDFEKGEGDKWTIGYLPQANGTLRIRATNSGESEQINWHIESKIVETPIFGV